MNGRTARTLSEALMQAMNEVGFNDEAEAVAKVVTHETRVHEQRQWQNTEPGVLVLTGTRWRIHFRPSQRSCDYWLYDDRRPITGSEWLEPLKQFASDRQRELDELDAG